MTKDRMNGMERVQATVAGRPVDRVPVFIWLNAHTGAKMMARYRPSKHWAWNAAARFTWDRFTRGGEMDSHELWRTAPMMFDVHTFNWANMYTLELGGDLTMAAHATPWDYVETRWRGGHFWMKDMYGVERAIGGIYPDQVAPAIRSIEDAVNYQMFPRADDRLYNVFRKARKTAPGASIASEIWGPQDFTATSLFGMERFMMFLIDYPDEMHGFLDRWTDAWIEVIRKCARAGADVTAIFDDYGYDHRTLISMPMWEEFSKPRLKRLVDAAHEAGTIAMLHSCGYQMPFLDHYVDLGIDMLQSFQPKAGNDFDSAYQSHGHRLTFITGIDIQRGEAMSPDELRDEIVHNYRIGGRNGRHILGFTHEMQYTMPDENVKVIFDTIDAIGRREYD